MTWSTIGNIFLYLFALIDSILIWILKIVYELFYKLTDIMLYSEDIIQTLGKRIGLILGIFMLFRLAISLITYLISPDKLNDGSKGGGKLLLNVIVSLVLLATVNIIFEQAYKIQGVVINSKFIEKIFFGSVDNVPDVDISYYLYTPLFAPNEDSLGTDCNGLWDMDKKIADLGDNGSCDDKLYEALGDDRRTIYQAKNNQDMSIVLNNYNVVTARYNNSYVFSYKYIFSTIVGVIVGLLIISFSMDLAVRAVKLLFLQIIAPIPIISNIDTNKGQDIFKKWYQECFQTYLTVFIRIIVINFATFMLTLILANYKDFLSTDAFLTVMLIVGALMFAKQVPKLIEDMFGIKTDGMALNPLKKFQDQALFGKNIIGLGAAGLAGGAAMGTNLLHGIYSSQNEKGLIGAAKGLAKGIGSGIAGGISAAGRGTIGAVRGQNFGQVFNGAYQGSNTARNNRASRNALGVHQVDVWSNSLQRKMGIDTEAEIQDANVKMYDEFVSSGESAVSISEGEIDKFDNRIIISNFRAGASATDQALIDRITNNTTAGGYGISSLAELREAMNDSSGTYDASQRAELNAAYNKLRGDIAGKYRERAASKNADDMLDGANSEFRDSSGFIYNPTTDTSVLTVKAHVENAQDIFSKNRENEVFVKNGVTDITGANIKPVTKQVKFESISIKNSGAYRKAHKVQEQTNREKK